MKSSCAKCHRRVHTRGLCYRHYMDWYREHRLTVREDRTAVYAPNHAWKFTPEHWWRWWEKRRLDERALERRASIQAFRVRLG